MTPEELKRMMEIIGRIPARSIPEEGRAVAEQRLEAAETLKTMRELHERLEKLLVHDQQKLREFEERLPRHFPPLPPPAG
jgi:hypothetical protein